MTDTDGTPASGRQARSTRSPGWTTLPAAGAESGELRTLMPCVPVKQSPAINPVMVIGTALPVPRIAFTLERSNLTVRSGMPSPSKSPIVTGAPGATATVPLRRIEDTSMSDGGAAGVGSIETVTYLPDTLLLRTRGRTLTSTVLTSMLD